VFEADYRTNSQEVLDRINQALGFPVFIKPANLGSSVGISKASNLKSLAAALEEAFTYDNRVVAEEAVDAMELEVAVLGNTGSVRTYTGPARAVANPHPDKAGLKPDSDKSGITPVGAITVKAARFPQHLLHGSDVEAASVGEILSNSEFYDYDSKYKSSDTQMIIPAKIPAQISEQVRSLAVSAYKAINCEGFARVDFFLDRKNDRILINEINSIPGFTRYSMFPLLWKEMGLAYPDLIERIIGLGYERYNAKNNREANHGKWK
jgi:D-alanine-D-alanine ligase